MNSGDHFIQDLASQGRVLLQGRQLPPGELDEATIDLVRRDYNNWTSQHGIFHEQVAREINYSASVISHWRQRMYAGDVQTVTRRINDWIEHDARRRRSEIVIDYVPTQAAEAMRGLIVAACSMGMMAAIAAPSGSGKTIVLQASAAKMAGLYLYCGGVMSSKSLLQGLNRAAGMTNTYRTSQVLMEQVIAQLQGTRRPLFLDEAHLLDTKALGTVRSIHDICEIPIILAGAGEILPLIDDSANGGGQFRSRCLQLNMLSGLNFNGSGNTPGGDYASRFAGGKPLFTVEEVRKLFEGSSIRFEPDALDLLTAVACIPGRGCLRTVRRVVELLAKQDPTRVIARKDVLDALGLMFADAGVHLAKLAQRHCEQARHAAG